MEIGVVYETLDSKGNPIARFKAEEVLKNGGMKGKKLSSFDRDIPKNWKNHSVRKEEFRNWRQVKKETTASSSAINSVVTALRAAGKTDLAIELLSAVKKTAAVTYRVRVREITEYETTINVPAGKVPGQKELTKFLEKNIGNLSLKQEDQYFDLENAKFERES